MMTTTTTNHHGEECPGDKQPPPSYYESESESESESLLPFIPRKFLQLLAFIVGAFILVISQGIGVELKYFRPLVADNNLAEAKAEADDPGKDSLKRDTLESESEYDSELGGGGGGDGGEDVPVPFRSRFQFPPPPSKWLEDIDTTSAAPKSCGAFKCFFHSRTNRQRLDEHRRQHHSSSNTNNNHNSTSTQEQSPMPLPLPLPTPTLYGYLVSELREAQWAGMLGGWKLANELSQNFSIRHYLRAAPEMLQCTDDFMGRLLNITTQNHGGRTVKNPFQNKKRKKRYNIATNDNNDNDNTTVTLIVQPIEVASSDAMLFGYSKRGTEAMNKMKELFSNSGDDNSTTTTTTTLLSSPLSGSKLLQFEARLRFDFNATVFALMTNSTTTTTTTHGGGASCLRKDFQVMVDPHTGGIYHLDLDRCFERKLVRFCPPKLQAFAGALLSKRSGGAIRATDFRDPAWVFPDCVLETPSDHHNHNHKKIEEP